MSQTAYDIEQSLWILSDEQKRNFLPYFFKTGKGQYGEGDKFIGVVIPKQRELVKQLNDVDFAELDKLLNSEYHECRMTALLYLTEQYKKAQNDKSSRDDIFDFYLSHHRGINNWDLVDLSAPYIVGQHLFLYYHTDEATDFLSELARKDNLWQQRIAVVSTLYFIRQQVYAPTFAIAAELEHHEHDLIHKAVGWMLREVGKLDIDEEEKFLLGNSRYKNLPRTMLRYAIERFEETKRQAYLKGMI